MHRDNLLKRLVNRLTAKHVYLTLPRGIEPAQDISRFLPIFQARTVFDVGANLGQSAILFLAWFPESKIYCFEPVGETFSQLQKNFMGNNRIDFFHLAFGHTSTKGKMLLKGKSEMFTLSKMQEMEASGYDACRTEEVEVATIDEFCRAKEIDRINFLKVDTEGGDLDVLRGAEHMLIEQQIDVIQVEAGMNQKNKWHIPLEILKTHLESKDYYLFGIYDQVNEWPTNEPHLRRSNPIFISRRVVEENAAAALRGMP